MQLMKVMLFLLLQLLLLLEFSDVTSLRITWTLGSLPVMILRLKSLLKRLSQYFKNTITSQRRLL